MRLETNGWLKDLRGASGDVVFKRQFGRQIVAQKARRSVKLPSLAQLEVRRRFGAAAKWAQETLNHALRGEPYRVAARVRETSAFGLAVRDYRLAPVIEELGLADYKGRVGDPIVVRARDDFEVVGVEIEVKNPAGTVLEEGAATNVEGKWTYAAQTAAPPNTVLTIVARATDRAGNTATESVEQGGTLPLIHAIDVTGYHGQVGDPIVVRASDDVEVTGVSVLMRDAAGEDIQDLVAVRVGDTWRAITTVAVPLGSTIVVTANATDAAGNTTAKELGVVVA